MVSDGPAMATSILTEIQLFWGPLSFLIVYFIVTAHPLRYPLQAIVSLGQIYGDVLYYATCMFDHYYKSQTYCRPEAYYFWFYFFFMNFIWIVIPGSEYIVSTNCRSNAANPSSTSGRQRYHHRTGIQGSESHIALGAREWVCGQTKG